MYFIESILRTGAIRRYFSARIPPLVCNIRIDHDAGSQRLGSTSLTRLLDRTAFAIIKLLSANRCEIKARFQDWRLGLVCVSNWHSWKMLV